ncbi:capsular polysaccharide synthesis protein [Flavobacterium sp. MFBS3-15]|uniref:capsular polysaccharide synthesis protein n=1 Tax=Flavobacterium sp. MFBS3-15 TaxID=2989816 RepID=UPI002236AFDE|nr:capsular polysaccharide synthesis protein [Flavobacterium sp. MFBS3-15]MCW4469564.1 capsular polysaccharide synthesis protein [Flavobacterium sp. MFBS3-15]
MEYTKIIWMYWHQGFEQAPEIVSRCVEQWIVMHPDWEIKLLDQNSVNQYAGPLPIAENVLNKLNLAHRSDLIRTQLLIKYGGVWADPTTFCTTSLNSWIPEYLSGGLFMFYKPGRDRIISNWFIAAEKDNMILKKMFKELCEYWQNNKFKNHGSKVWYEAFCNRLLNRSLPLTKLWFTFLFKKVLRIYPYMVYHYKFYQIISSTKKYESIWNSVPKFSAHIPHKLLHLGLLKPLTSEGKDWIDQKKSPIFKLTWKLGVQEFPKGSLLKYIFENE